MPTKQKLEAVATMGPVPDVQSFIDLFATLPDARNHRTSSDQTA